MVKGRSGRFPIPISKEPISCLAMLSVVEQYIDEKYFYNLATWKIRSILQRTQDRESPEARIFWIPILVRTLQMKVLTKFIRDEYYTITGSLKRSVVEGVLKEQAIAAMAIGLLGIQLGGTEEGEALFHLMKRPLLNLLKDEYAHPYVRTKCAEALGICAFIVTDDFHLKHCPKLMQDLESIFSNGNYHNTHADIEAQRFNLSATALQVWSLLLSTVPPNLIRSTAKRHISNLSQFLEYDKDGTHILGVLGAEAISLLFELARQDKKNFKPANISRLCVRLKQMSARSNKVYDSEQKSNLRNMLLFIETGDFQETTLTVGNKCVHIDSWAKKRQYDSLHSVLERFLNIHIKENSAIRCIFNLDSFCGYRGRVPMLHLHMHTPVSPASEPLNSKPPGAVIVVSSILTNRKTNKSVLSFDFCENCNKLALLNPQKDKYSKYWTQRKRNHFNNDNLAARQTGTLSIQTCNCGMNPTLA